MIALPGTARRRWARRAGVAAAAAAAIAVLAGCAAGQVAGTAQEVSADDAASADLGTIHLRNVAVIAPSDNSYPQGSDAGLQLRIVNGGDTADRLTGVTTSEAGSVGFYPNAASAASVSAGSPSSAPGALSAIDVPAGRSVGIGYTANDLAIMLTGLKGRLWPAQSFAITFQFASAGSVTFSIPVQLAALPASPATAPISAANEG